jgi:hypothetical protein
MMDHKPNVSHPHLVASMVSLMTDQDQYVSITLINAFKDFSMTVRILNALTMFFSVKMVFSMMDQIRPALQEPKTA